MFTRAFVNFIMIQSNFNYPNLWGLGLIVQILKDPDNWKIQIVKVYLYSGWVFFNFIIPSLFQSPQIRRIYPWLHITDTKIKLLSDSGNLNVSTGIWKTKCLPCHSSHLPGIFCLGSSHITYVNSKFLCENYLIALDTHVQGKNLSHFTTLTT